jgi:hypothetical protein
MNQVGIRKNVIDLKDGTSFRRSKAKEFIVELKDRDMNIILLLDLEIESKSSVFGIRGSLGEERGSFCLSPMVKWLSLDQDLVGL